MSIKPFAVLLYGGSSYVQEMSWGSTRPNREEIKEAILTAMAACSKLFLVLDGVDEYEPPANVGADFLVQIHEIQKSTNFNLMLTSRHNNLIEGMFHPCTVLDIEAHNQDVEMYLDSRISRLPLFQSTHGLGKLREQIKTVISKAVQGM